MEENKPDRVDEGLFGKKSSMPFLDHLEELRWRLIKSVAAVVLFSFVAFIFADQIIIFIRRPLGDVQLYNIAVTGTFYAYLQVSLIVGIFAALPITFYQLWSFISPGLYKSEKRKVIPLVLISTLLFLVGAAFCFEVVLPVSFAFLISFAGELIVNNITIGSYISFVGLLLMAFGFGFQLPLVSYFLGKMGIVTSQLLAKGRRYAIVVILVMAAVITPPDVFTQFLLALPIYILYEISIIVVKMTQKEVKKD